MSEEHNHLSRMADVVSAKDIRKTFRNTGEPLEILRGIDLTAHQGEMIAIVGESGSGKSTLLHILGALDRPSNGSVHFGETDIYSLNSEALAEFRRHSIGFIFQFHNLLPEFTALENVAMPLLLRGVSRQTAEGEASRWLHEVGLEQRSHHRAGELSGGEQQRVALARALITQPKVLLADEPTGDLDSRTADSVFELIARLHRDYQLTSLIATHNFAFARRCHRVLRLQRGRMEEVAPETLLG